MWPEYQDIIERAGRPDWYWNKGVPRYGAFSPEMCGIYDTSVAFLEIACQDCAKRFHVAVSFHALHGDPVLPTADKINWFHYGDPPRHGCIGDTMNVDTLKVIEFWQKQFPLRWVRRPDLEFDYPLGQWPEAPSKP